MKKVFLLVPDGVGIKNYLYSDVFKESNIELHLFHNFDPATLEMVNSKLELKGSLEIPNYRESIKEKYLRELIHLSRLKYNAQKENNPTILKFWKRGHKKLKNRLFYAVIEFLSSFKRSYKSILAMENRYQNVLRRSTFYKEIIEILKEHQPDLIFCTHQRSLKAPTIFRAAKDLGITAITVIYSWDNLPKARLALQADYYLAWSEYMKNELLNFYTEITEDKVVVTGTPQFEFYDDPENIIEKEVFFERFGLDINKKIVCFSGDDVRTSPYDPHYLEDLAVAISRSDLKDKIQIVFRRCPVDLSGRYKWVIDKYPDLIREVEPLWNFDSEVWSAVYPTYADVQLLVSLAHYSHLVVNVGSTMAFDFGKFGKPCAYINYDHKKDPNWSVDTIYKYQHFRSMPGEKAVFWLNSKEEIASSIKKVLEEPATNIKDWFEIVVEPNVIASKEIKKVIER
ncbi:UDP-glycosyltransferase [Aureitalea sp. L0-47]|uniref:MGDG synthase family glycosyltransferase n=1 Tax=Aureitalea sp. L0-47 TaxID=2816962 RepID=UPI0022388BE1|nr:UDP-glycosyltransferase [Aureitalea sp. L0-47]MCW5519168.1 UDP-glycosyltransferase [Aureitalea sp. L0-47]